MRASGLLLAALAITASATPLQASSEPFELLDRRKSKTFSLAEFLKKLVPLGKAVDVVIKVIPVGFTAPSRQRKSKGKSKGKDKDKRDKSSDTFSFDIGELVKVLGPLGETIDSLADSVPIAVKVDATVPTKDKGKVDLGPVDVTINDDEATEGIKSDLGELLKNLGPVSEAIDRVLSSVHVDLSVEVPAKDKGAKEKRKSSGKKEEAKGEEDIGPSFSLSSLLEALAPLSKAIDDLVATIPSEISSITSVVPVPVTKSDKSVDKRRKSKPEEQGDALASSLGELLDTLAPIADGIEELIEAIPEKTSILIPIVSKDKGEKAPVSVNAKPVKGSS